MKKLTEDLLSHADIKINGSNPWDIQVKNDKFYKRVMTQGTLGLGESYMDGWWDAKELDTFFFKAISANLEKELHKITRLKNIHTLLYLASAYLINLSSASRAFQIGKKHYDVGNDLFELMLDKKHMAYTCGYWKNASNLEEAQETKLDLICKKLNLKPGMQVLDIGCGWGGFVKYAAEKYGVQALGITVSEEQAKLAREKCANLPIEIKVQDYRSLDGKFDRVLSIGMFEHVGCRNYKTYMQTCKKLLKEDGLSLLHTIGGNKSTNSTDPWINKYIFPNSMIPSIKQIGSSIENVFVMEDWHNFGDDYDKTLMAWFENFDQNWSKLSGKYDERFYRMWKFYLLLCAASFRARKNQLWQIVLSPKGVPGGYESIR